MKQAEWEALVADVPVRDETGRIVMMAWCAWHKKSHAVREFAPAALGKSGICRKANAEQYQQERRSR